MATGRPWCGPSATPIDNRSCSEALLGARLRSEQERLRALEEVERQRKRPEAEHVYLQEEIRADHDFEAIVGKGAALMEALGSSRGSRRPTPRC